MSAASRVEFNAIRAAFMQRLSAPELPAAALKLGYRIAYRYMNVEKREAFVGQDRLAEDLGGISVRHVQRLLVILKACGLEIEAGNGRGKASTYRIAAGPERVTSGRQADRKQPPKRATFRGRKGRHFETQKGDLYVAPTLVENQMPDGGAYAPPSGGRENARLRRAVIPRPARAPWRRRPDR